MLFFPCHSAHAGECLYTSGGRIADKTDLADFCVPVALCVLASECLVGLKLVIL